MTTTPENLERNLDKKKLQLIEWIIALEDETMLNEILELLRTSVASSERIQNLTSGGRLSEEVDIDKIAEEQQVKPLDMGLLERNIAGAGFTDPVEEMLAKIR
ncbi:MAG: hypothetical protein WBA17_09865 [Saprospiraceae bacterium]